jgi:WhiB family redox-sensing transcriptional regulator
MFFPEDIPDPNIRHTVTVIAKGMCGGCPVKNQCFEYALETQQKHGIWGGTSPDER